MREMYILLDVLEDLDRRDYEYALMEISELEGGVYDHIKTLIAAKEYAEAKELINTEIEEFASQMYS
jgi:hypothetical protein